MKQVNISITIAKTVLMRNKWNKATAIASLSNVTLGDELLSISETGECTG